MATGPRRTEEFDLSMMQCQCNQVVLAKQVEEAFSFFKRLKGLMFRTHMQSETAMLLAPCPQIHTCFMRFAIDVLFLDKQGKVVHVIENMKPWRLSPIVRHASQTLEMPSGTLQGRVKTGDQIIFKEI